jgi:multidrug efflux pump subunit AcrA (membrane-fusion protein)
MGLIRWTLPVLGVAAITALVSTILRPAEPLPGSPPRLTAHAGVVPRQQTDVLTRQGGVVIQVEARPGEVVPTQRPLVRVNGPAGLEVLIAPFAGTVTDVFVRAGEALGPGTVVATIADLTRLQIEATDVDAYLVALIHVGQRTRLEVDGRDLLGRVSRIGLVPDGRPGGDAHYQVLIEPPEQERDLQAGMPVLVTFLD